MLRLNVRNSIEIKIGKVQNVHFYQLPAKPGKYVATKVGEKNINGKITGAALSPNEKSFVLLSYGKIYFFSLNSNVSAAQPLTCRKFLRAGQAEAITYVNNDDLLITNEGGKIFYMKRINLGSKQACKNLFHL